MKIEVNIEKKYFIVLLSVVLVLGIIGIGYAFGGNNPSVVGHNIGEIDWSETIPSDVKINGLVSLKGQAVISSDDGYVRVGDLTGGDGKRSLMLRS
ncbi:MAG: hypothetical protein Q7S27_01675, partial [Nanoarchaeota archaeon]|nr:hypothetical protein [Nanoarchaeota archaeon]